MIEDQLKKSYVKGLITFALASLIYSGCKEEIPVITEDEKPTAIIKGKATASVGFDSENYVLMPDAKISLNELKENNELIISGAETLSNDNGEFSLSPNITEGKNYFLSAEKNDIKLLAYISADMKNGLTFYTQPLNIETTIEALIYLDIIKKNYLIVSYADISDYINTSLAEAIYARQELIPSVADIIYKKVEARNAFIKSAEIGATNEEIKNIITIRKSAKEVFERDLFFASNTYLIRIAYNTYFESMINAFINSGISSDKCLKIIELTHQALLKESSVLDAEIRFGFIKNSTLLYSKVLQFAVLEKFSGLGIQQNDLIALLSGGNFLEGSVQNSNTASEINSAFIDYQESVGIVLNNKIGVKSDIIAGFNNKVKDSKSNYISLISAAANSSNLIDVYLNFYLELKNDIEFFLQSINDNQMVKAAEIIVLLNIHF